MERGEVSRLSHTVLGVHWPLQEDFAESMSLFRVVRAEEKLLAADVSALWSVTTWSRAVLMAARAVMSQYQHFCSLNRNCYGTI